MISPQQLVTRLVMSNPQIRSNPRAVEMLEVIERGDSARGEKIAENLCATYGVSRDEAVAQARRYFNL